MPLQLTSGDRRILLIAGGVFLVLVVTTVVLTGGTNSQQDVPSTYSTASGGSKAAFLLLRESGYKVATWEQPLRDLPDGKGKTLVLADPAYGPASQDRQRLNAFLQSGGRVIAAGSFASYYLPENQAIPDPLAGMEGSHQTALSPSRITRVAPEITLAAHAHWYLTTGTVPLYGAPDKPTVVQYKVGKGEVLWLAGATPLTNAGLREQGNLEFFFAAMGDPSQAEILWDEYGHGYRHSSAVSGSTRIIRWIFLQLAIFSVAILLAYSRRSGPVWMPPGESRLSPLEFVRTLGSLYQHANAGSVAVDISYQRFRYLLTRRLGLSINAPVDDLDRAVRERGSLPKAGFAETLRECEATRYDPNVPPSAALRLVQNLFDYARSLKLTKAPY